MTAREFDAGMQELLSALGVSAPDVATIRAGIAQLTVASAENMCLTASCLAHRKPMFLQRWGPDADRWCHLNGWPCDDDPNCSRERE